MGIIGGHSGPKVKDWTILVYGGGTNNLDESIRKNWDGADDQPLPENVDVFVRHFDREGQSTDVHMTSGETSQNVNEGPPVDSAAPQTLGKFLQDGMRQYPAKRYLTVISSHGKGADGVIEDDRAQHTMSPQHFQQALEIGRLANGGRPIDAVLFDACQMAALEMATQLTGSALVAVASMDNIAGLGFSLAEVVKSAGSSPDAYDLAERLVHNDAPQQLNSCLSLAAIDLDRLGPLQTAMADLAGQLRGLQPESAKEVRQVSQETRRNTISPDAWELVDMLADHILSSETFSPETLEQWKDTTKPGQAVALATFCQDLLAQEALMTQNPGLQKSLSTVLTAHDQAVFSSRNADRSGAAGLTVSLPLASTDGPLYSDATTLNFERLTGWSGAVHVVVPPGVAATQRESWLEQELRSKGVQLPVS